MSKRWEAVHFERGSAFWGFVLRSEDGSVHSYERTAGAGVRRAVPSFTRFEHAQLFVSQWPEPPVLARGPSYDLGALDAHLEKRPHDEETAGYAWGFVIDVLDAVGEADDLDLPEMGLPPSDEIRDGLERLVRVTEQLDR